MVAIGSRARTVSPVSSGTTHDLAPVALISSFVTGSEDVERLGESLRRADLLIEQLVGALRVRYGFADVPT